MYQELTASQVLHWMLMVMVSSSCLGSAWSDFMFTNTLLNLAFSSVFCMLMLHANVIHKCSSTDVAYLFFVLFVIPKSSFVQLLI